MAKRIIDVSEHQKRIDWVKVKASGIDGAILRVGFGDNDTAQDDKYFLYNVTECERLGIPYEVYLYSYADSDKHIQSEINHIKRLLAGRNVRVWFDLEYRPAKAYWRKAVVAFLKAFPSGGVYSWEWVFTDILDGIDCPRWICHYGLHNSGKPEYDYKPSTICHGWQYTSRASVPGITGNVDMSEWYKDFAQAVQRPSAGRESVVARMIAWEGYDERNGKYKALIDGYNDYLPTAIKSGTVNYSVKYSDEWCATAASYAYIACGLGYLFPVECSCPRMITLAKKMGIWQENDGYIPDIADAVLYDWDDSGKGDNAGTADHIGIVISVNKNTGTFVVMEGNKNEAVGRRTMRVNGKYIRGFVTPKFGDTPAKATAPATPAKTATPVKTTTKKSVYEVSKTGTPNKTTCIKWGLLKNNQKVTPRLQPNESAKPCSFAPVQPLTRIEVYDYITTAKRWAYCKVGGKYGFILASSIADYLRTPKQPIDKVVKWVLADDFGTLETRRKALKTLGYNPDEVQAVINGKQPETGADSPRIRVWPVWFFEENESLYGDCTAILEYDSKNSVNHCILIDTAMSSASSVVIRKLKAAGVKKIDAVVISHAHGDHYGGLSDIVEAFPVGHIYVPNADGLDKYQRSYGDALRRQAKKATGSTLNVGDSFTIGHVTCRCIFQAPADKLTEHDDHHFINNQSMVLRFTLDGHWIFHTAGDLQNEGNNLLVKSVNDLKADIYKVQWHGDAGACNETICQAVKPTIAFSNYHHTERSGRATTRKRLEDVGAVVARNAENGDIYIDCQGETMKLTCSKGNLSRTFVKKN